MEDDIPHEGSRSQEEISPFASVPGLERSLEHQILDATAPGYPRYWLTAGEDTPLIPWRTIVKMAVDDEKLGNAIVAFYDRDGAGHGENPAYADAVRNHLLKQMIEHLREKAKTSQHRETR